MAVFDLLPGAAARSSHLTPSAAAAAAASASWTGAVDFGLGADSRPFGQEKRLRRDRLKPAAAAALSREKSSPHATASANGLSLERAAGRAYGQL